MERPEVLVAIRQSAGVKALILRKKAMRATAANIKHFEEQRAEIEQANAAKKAAAEAKKAAAAEAKAAKEAEQKQNGE